MPPSQRAATAIAASLLLAALSSPPAGAQVTNTNLVYWDFNDTAGFSQTSAAFRSAAFSPDGGPRAATAYMKSDFGFSDGSFNGSVGISRFLGSTQNAILPDSTVLPSGAALALQSDANNFRFLEFGVDATGLSSLIVSYATRGTATGFHSNQFEYSIDGGGSYIAMGALYDVETRYRQRIIDLTGVAGVDGNADLRFRIVFSGASSSTGNNRIDNLQINSGVAGGNVAPEPGTLGLLAMGITAMARRRRAE